MAEHAMRTKLANIRTMKLPTTSNPSLTFTAHAGNGVPRSERTLSSSMLAVMFGKACV
jgi:hypothetical protein